MAQVSTGMGLAILGGCILGAAALTSHNFGTEAMAQGTGTERRIVSAGVYADGENNQGHHWAYRVWSDNTVEVKWIGRHSASWDGGSKYEVRLTRYHYASNYPPAISAWQIVDDGTNAYFRSDVDESRSVDAGDISAVLLDFGSTTDQIPPPPIDCTINSPR
jgi:hypothetical protein